MSVEPVVGYARLGESRIAYQVMGEGLVDILITAGYWGTFDVEWEDPKIRLFLEQLASFARVIQFDRLGTGASDPVISELLPPWEGFADEIRCVLEAVGSDRVALFAISDVGPAAMLFAATNPERCRALILFDSAARWLVADDYPFGMSTDQAEAAFDSSAAETWGTGAVSNIRMYYPSKAGDPRFRRWVARMERSISTPDIAVRYNTATRAADARAVLPSIRVPTLVLQRLSAPPSPVEHGRFLAEHIPGARLVELPGGDAFPYWEHPELTIAALEEFLAVEDPIENTARSMAAVLFTDIVDSTKRAESMGDRHWAALLNVHDETASDVLARYDGRLVKSTGDGVLGMLDGPGRAIRAAEDLRAKLQQLDIQIRCGIHTGEVELRKDDLSGIAVHIASRAMGAAHPGEIIVTSTVRDLIAGSGIPLADRGSHELKGVDGTWHLYSVEPSQST